MESKITNIHGYNEDGTAYIAVPSLSDKAVKDATGAVISDKYATKTEVEQAIADIDVTEQIAGKVDKTYADETYATKQDVEQGISAVSEGKTIYKCIWNQTTYEQVSQAIADGLLPMVYAEGRWFRWYTNVQSGNGHNDSSWHYFMAPELNGHREARLTGTDWWYTSTFDQKFVSEDDIISSSYYDASEVYDNQVFSAKASDKRYALKSEVGTGSGTTTVTGGKTVIPYNSQWSVVEEAINGDGICVVEYNNQQYYYSMHISNPSLGRNFAWFTSPMNTHSRVNGISVIECRYDINAGTTIWNSSANTGSWLTRTDGDGLYGSYGDVEDLKERVTALEEAQGSEVLWSSLPSDTEIQGMPPAGTLWKGTGDWDGQTVNKLYVVTDGTPMDFGTVAYDGTRDLVLWWVTLSDTDGWTYSYANGNTANWSDMPKDNDGFALDFLQGQPPMTQTAHTSNGDVSITLAVAGESESGSASNKLVAEISCNKSEYFIDSWHQETINGVEVYTREARVGSFGDGWSAPFSSDDIITVVPTANYMVQAMTDGWIGAINYNPQENRLKIASMNPTTIHLTIVAERR